MDGILTQTDLVVFFGSLIAVMAVGLWVGRREKTSEDYFLAGKDTPWWGVAGSVFGTNVSANHMVGMMAVGFTLGFVESHFEITAIAGLLMLCYFFLPIYRKLHIYTLSDYLSKRYDDRARVAYSVIMLLIIVLIMILPAFYIGSRTVNILMLDQATVQGVIDSAAAGSPERLSINKTHYIIGVLIMAVVTGAYTIVGGLKAVIVTDVIQSVLMLLGIMIVAWCTFNHELIGGWGNLRLMDAGGHPVTSGDGWALGREKIHLYLPSDHPQRPWTGMLSGLLVLHLYYWGANQFIVQRALSARSLKEARMGIILAGFVKLLIPFLSIGTGVAAYYLFQQEQPGIKLDGDTAFPMLLREVVAPLGVAGLVGLVAAGLVGAILSSVDSMMNSASTLITFDFYKKYINPNATDVQLVRLGRIIIGVLVLLAAGLTILVFDPNTQEPFFSHVAKHQSKLVAGLVAAFLLGMAWKGATAAGGLASIVVGVVVSYGFPPLYAAWLADVPAIKSLFGSQFNFFHSVFIAFIAASIANVIVSKCSGVDEEKSKYTWVGLKLFREMDLIHFSKKLIGTIVVFVLLGFFMTGQLISPLAAGLIGAIWTWVMFMDSLFQLVLSAAAKGRGYSLLREDRFWAGLLAACAVFMLFYFA